MNSNIEILPNKTALIQRALAVVLDQISAAIAERGQFTIALAGGSTPKPLYEAIAVQELPWEKIKVFWGDERYVPPTHPDSNEGMARQAWLDQVPIPAANIFAMPTDEADPAVAADRYEAMIREAFSAPAGSVPQFDLILLGMGDDGHTASLFPHTEALQVRDRLVTVGNKDGQPRITFTVPLINQARCILFVVAGSSKQAALSHVFAETDDATLYPSRLIQSPGVLWLLDEPAGAAL